MSGDRTRSVLTRLSSRATTTRFVYTDRRFLTPRVSGAAATFLAAVPGIDTQASPGFECGFVVDLPTIAMVVPADCPYGTGPRLCGPGLSRRPAGQSAPAGLGDHRGGVCLWIVRSGQNRAAGIDLGRPVCRAAGAVRREPNRRGPCSMGRVGRAQAVLEGRRNRSLQHLQHPEGPRGLCRSSPSVLPGRFRRRLREVLGRRQASRSQALAVGTAIRMLPTTTRDLCRFMARRRDRIGIGRGRVGRRRNGRAE